MAAKEKKIVPPKLNKFMHPRNPYKTPPSFKQLAKDYPEFRAHCSYDVGDKVHLDFKNPNALRALTTCLLHHDFGLEVNIPEGRLVPTLPLRLNYLLWLEDLLSLAARRRSGGDGGGGGGGQGAAAVVGADIGTGAACVYPLLGAAHFGWCMLATETDAVSYKSALENMEKNRLAGQIAVLKVEEKTILKGALDHSETLAKVSMLRPRSDGGGGRFSHSTSPKKARGHSSEVSRWEKTEEAEQGKKSDKKKKDEEEGNKNGKEDKELEEKNPDSSERDYTFDFTMCNPPFFSSEEEVDTMAKSKKGRGEPCAAPTGSIHEKVTEGGEVEFIRQMVEESQLLKDRVRIFTTLIGTKAHVKEVKRMVEGAKPSSSVFTEFCQGRTMRWGAAWTFAAGVSLGEVRSKKEMATNKPIILLLPRTLMSVYTVPAAWSKVQGWLKTLKVKVEVFKSSKYFVSANIKAFKPTWLNLRRRRREKLREEQQQQQHKQPQNGTSGEVSEGASQKRRTEGKAEGEEERESKRVRVATEEEDAEAETEREKMEEEEDEEEVDEEEGAEEEEEENHQESTSTKQTDEEKSKKTDTSWGDCTKPRKGGLKCILRCNLQVKQTGGLISVEAYYLGGSCGKEGLNQMIQYMRNQLSQPFA
ncbi:RNA N6-adenosine-methyltransferase METTL16-like [Eriocheir sinensis]|uniref:RNA N6-adenosine-methyltransferase METTL16-like n=1 Tax=Eriocheir sinensis TaxID=95602 RepID=UPI0021C9D3E7|nr:RNA N6-adenosine-methyltransferase METTL16-like [Eriocheir sinensis]XP_050717978.1 RNA N6-adenosine-methyltransferase METTL16-like [Eriocheir sinensis]